MTALSARSSLSVRCGVAALAGLPGLVGLGLAPAARAADLPAPTAGGAMGLLLLGAAMALVAALAGLSWQRRRQADLAGLRAERLRVQRLLTLVDGTLWRTDAEHRVVGLRLAASGDAASLPSPVGAPLWQSFDAASAERLRDRLQSQAAFDDLDLALDGGVSPGWRLRARPCHDDAGRFDGFEGSASLAGPRPAAPRAEAVLPSTAGDEAAAFSYTVSHDLRAPIRVVEGFTRILKEDYGHLLDRVGNDHLERVLGAAARMNSMIDALLALSRLGAQPLARQSVNLSQLAAYVIEDLRRQSPERRAEVILAPDLQAAGDPTLLRVVLENLLGNAWKYSAQRSIATIEFSRTAHEGRSAYCVADNGAGFDMRFADRLFGVFQRLHSSSDFPGTGVGLASVRRIVQRHGGEIWAEAEPDRGARFYFTLPG